MTGMRGLFLSSSAPVLIYLAVTRLSSERKLVQDYIVKDLGYGYAHEPSNPVAQGLYGPYTQAEAEALAERLNAEHKSNHPCSGFAVVDQLRKYDD